MSTNKYRKVEVGHNRWIVTDGSCALEPKRSRWRGKIIGVQNGWSHPDLVVRYCIVNSEEVSLLLHEALVLSRIAEAVGKEIELE